MMIGIGTPRSHNKIPRPMMDSFSTVARNKPATRGNRSKHVPNVRLIRAQPCATVLLDRRRACIKMEKFSPRSPDGRRRELSVSGTIAALSCWIGW